MSDWKPSFWDEYDQDYDENITCKYCGETALHWDETGEGWRLFDDDGERHVCPQRSSFSTDDFDEL